MDLWTVFNNMNEAFLFFPAEGFTFPLGYKVLFIVFKAGRHLGFFVPHMRMSWCLVGKVHASLAKQCILPTMHQLLVHAALSNQDGGRL
jgi:hypothetical protein